MEDINAKAKIAEEMYFHEEKLLKYITEGNEEKLFGSEILSRFRYGPQNYKSSAVSPLVAVFN